MLSTQAQALHLNTWPRIVLAHYTHVDVSFGARCNTHAPKLIQIGTDKTFGDAMQDVDNELAQLQDGNAGLIDAIAELKVQVSASCQFIEC